MSTGFQVSTGRGLAALRRLKSRQPAPERCELCASTIPDEHQHLVDPGNRRLLCVCGACAILFDHAGITQYRRVPRDVRALTFDIDDQSWSRLSIPISLVFFFRSSVSGTVMALYPSPAGPTEGSVDEETWEDLASVHPALSGLRADVEALLVKRVKASREYYIVPIDECYKLTGVIRRHWQGFLGGDAAWQRIDGFFADLKQRARPEGAGVHA